MNILFRCDGSSSLGMGHVVRCLSLADYFKDNYNIDINFAVRKSNVAIKKIKNKYKVMKSNEIDFSYFNWLLTCIKRTNSKILILDSRDNINPLDIRKLKKKTNIFVVTIDDPEDKKYEADQVFLHPVPQNKNIDKKRLNGNIYEGWDFVILREIFTSTNWGSYPKNSKVKKIFLSMGSTDYLNLTSKILKLMNKVGSPFKIDVVLGHGNENINSIEELSSQLNYEIKIYHKPKCIAKLMSNANLGIVSFGMTSYELASLGIPSYNICLSDDHFQSSILIDKTGIGKTFGTYNYLNNNQFYEDIAKLLEDDKKLLTMSKKTNSLKFSNLKKITNIILGGL